MRWSGGDTVSYGELDDRIEDLYASIKEHYRVESSARPLGTGLDRYQLEEGHVLRLDLTFHFDQAVHDVTVTSTLDRVMQPDHRHLASVSFGGAVQEAALDASRPSQRFDEGRTAYLATARTFLRLGIGHIFTGYDHLAFLIGLLIATETIGSLVKVITSFTVAHSITLALATFDLVILPTRLTEGLIALSIAYVAAENLTGSRIVERWRVTFLFGLVHGFGFSNVLREMQLPRGSLALSLFTFNTGVEIGQLVFVVATFSLVKFAASGWRPLRPAVSAAVGCLAAYWFVQRIFTG